MNAGGLNVAEATEATEQDQHGATETRRSTQGRSRPRFAWGNAGQRQGLMSLHFLKATEEHRCAQTRIRCVSYRAIRCTRMSTRRKRPAAGRSPACG